MATRPAHVTFYKLTWRLVAGQIPPFFNREYGIQQVQTSIAMLVYQKVGQSGLHPSDFEYLSSWCLILQHSQAGWPFSPLFRAK